MSFLIYAMVYVVTVSGKSAQELARQMTIDLQKYRQALEASDNHIIITDSEGVILYANPAACLLTGFTREEMAGQTPRLWGRQMGQEFYTKFWDEIKNKQHVFRGEMTNKRKGGMIYKTYATVSPILDDKQLLGFVGVEYDITERKKQEEEMERMNKLLVGRELKMVELKQQLKNINKGSS